MSEKCAIVIDLVSPEASPVAQATEFETPPRVYKRVHPTAPSPASLHSREEEAFFDQLREVYTLREGLPSSVRNGIGKMQALAKEFYFLAICTHMLYQTFLKVYDGMGWGLSNGPRKVPKDTIVGVYFAVVEEDGVVEEHPSQYLMMPDHPLVKKHVLLLNADPALVGKLEFPACAAGNLNHSCCCQNCAFVTNRGVVYAVTTKEVSPYEQFLADYGSLYFYNAKTTSEMMARGEKVYPCMCGPSGCPLGRSFRRFRGQS